ncbi:nitrate- and nitrite sensing domain-containing protein [Micromonospora sp. NPDC023633]|uniref:sensor histidine kinase n=1 Tax=Micromonospora sp. NPDC023633 TaxID=3154320 RepID=UPI0033D4569F
MPDESAHPRTSTDANRSDMSRLGGDRRRLHRRSVRFQIWSLLVVAFATLLPLWAFGMYLTVPSAVSTSQSQQRNLEIGVPTDALDAALSAERKASVVYLANRESGRPALDAARAVTDQAAEKYRNGAMDMIGRIGEGSTPRLAREMDDRLGQLSRQRSAIDSGSAEPEQVFAYYNAAIDNGIRVLNSLTSVDDATVHSFGEALSRLARSRALLQEVDARVSAAIAAGTLTRDDWYALVTNIGAVNGSYATALPNLPAQVAAEYNEIASSEASLRLRALEETIAQTRPGTRIRVTAAEWDDATKAVLDQVHAFELRTATVWGTSAEPVARWTLIRAAIATGFGLLGVIALVSVSIRIGRTLIRESSLLRNRMDDVATVRLPELVQRLRAGTGVDPDDITQGRAPERPRTRELDDLGGSFNRVYRVAIEAASGEAKLRQGVSRVFVNLARRNQTLLHRQLKLLDEIERQSSDPDQLAQLFSLDHLATRMRRHAESLIILSGEAPGRGWSNPVPLQDLVRAAVTEVEDYRRITVHVPPSVGIVGSVVADLIHLLAELIENATLYSPADTQVQVRGMRAANGFVVEVEDAGVSMSEAAMAKINSQLVNPPEFDLTDGSQLGLFVVGQLAARQGIRVSLRGSPYGGTTAIVLLPPALLADVNADPPLERVPVGRLAAVDSYPQRRAAASDRASFEAARRRGSPLTVPAELGAPPRPVPDLPSLILPPAPRNPVEVVPDIGRPALPRRSRQAASAPQPRAGSSGAESAPARLGPAHDRNPDEVRSLMSAIQLGWDGMRPPKSRTDNDAGASSGAPSSHPLQESDQND